MSPGQLEDYISRLERELRRRGLQDSRILAEAREHLVDAVEEGRRRGLPVDEAEQEALERFGTPGIVAAHVHEEGDDMTGFSGVLARVWQRKWWILAPTITAAIVTSVASYYFLPTRYRADVKMIVVSPVQSGVTVVPRTTELERSVETLLSRTVVEAIIKEFGLYREELERTSMREVVDQMRRDMSITSLKAGSDGNVPGVFSVSFAASDPEQARRVTERLATVLIDENVSRELERFESANESLESQIAEVGRQLREHEAKVERLGNHGGGPLSQADLIPYEVLKEQYKALSVRRLEAEVAAHREARRAGNQLRILDRAQLPEGPDGSNRRRVTLLGTLIGLLIGLALVVLPRSSNGAPPTLAEA